MKPLYKYILSSLVTLILWSCQSESPTLDDIGVVGEQVIFGANISNVVSSRSLPRKGKIMDGTLKVIYLSQDRKYEEGKVIFRDGVGYSYREEAGNMPQLLWGDIASASLDRESYNFYIDNLEVEDLLVMSPVYFKAGEDHPYQFKKYKIYGTDEYGNEISSGDLIWGSVYGIDKSNSISINLKHLMSLLKLEISMDEFDNRIPKRIWITNCRSSIERYDRGSGYITSTNTSVDIAKLPYLYILEENENILDSEDWERDNDSKNHIKYFNSPEYLVPPQDFSTDYRPRLVIELDDGSIFSGLLPRYLYMDTGSGNMAPLMLEFKQGYKLTLSVRISREANSLIFMSAYLYMWNDKGSFNVTGKQASLADEDDFIKLFDVYQKASNDKDKNQGDKYEFYKWGFFDEVTQKWIFNLFQNQSLTESKVSGRMPEDDKIPYEFSLHYATITIFKDDGTELAITADNGGAEKLKDLLTKGEIAIGVYSDSDLQLLAGAYKENPDKYLEPWGRAINEQLWQFSLYQDLELKASDFSGIMPEDSKYKYEFIFADKTVTIILDNKKKVVLTSKNEGEAKLKALLSKSVVPEE